MGCCFGSMHDMYLITLYNVYYQETIFGTDNLGNRVVEKVSLSTTQVHLTRYTDVFVYDRGQIS
jgi:hypothetical protein